MIVLALDTSTARGSLALVEEGRDPVEAYLTPGTTHSKTLLPEIDRLLSGRGLTPAGLDLIAVGLGPGSFTGLRIGLAAAKGLAWAAGKPLIGVPTLDALAQGYSGEAVQVCPLLDARKGQFYTALYKPGLNGAPERQSDFLALTPEDLTEFIQEETVFFGEGLSIWGPALAEQLGTKYRRGPESLDHPRAALTAKRAVYLWQQGAETDPANIIPMYVRPPDIRVPTKG